MDIEDKQSLLYFFLSLLGLRLDEVCIHVGALLCSALQKKQIYDVFLLSAALIIQV